jgi:hypothetical protein
MLQETSISDNACKIKQHKMKVSYYPLCDMFFIGRNKTIIAVRINICKFT